MTTLVLRGTELEPHQISDNVVLKARFYSPVVTVGKITYKCFRESPESGFKARRYEVTTSTQTMTKEGN